MYNVFVILNLNIYLVNFFFYVFCFFKIKFELRCISRGFISFKWAKHTTHSRHMNCLTDIYMVDLIYECLLL